MRVFLTKERHIATDKLQLQTINCFLHFSFIEALIDVSITLVSELGHSDLKLSKASIRAAYVMLALQFKLSSNETLSSDITDKNVRFFARREHIAP